MASPSSGALPAIMPFEETFQTEVTAVTDHPFLTSSLTPPDNKKFFFHLRTRKHS
jgi:hypothetical protein